MFKKIDFFIVPQTPEISPILHKRLRIKNRWYRSNPMIIQMNVPCRLRADFHIQTNIFLLLFLQMLTSDILRLCNLIAVSDRDLICTFCLHDFRLFSYVNGCNKLRCLGIHTLCLDAFAFTRLSKMFFFFVLFFPTSSSADILIKGLIWFLVCRTFMNNSSQWLCYYNSFVVHRVNALQVLLLDLIQFKFFPQYVQTRRDKMQRKWDCTRDIYDMQTIDEERTCAVGRLLQNRLKTLLETNQLVLSFWRLLLLFTTSSSVKQFITTSTLQQTILTNVSTSDEVIATLLNQTFPFMAKVILIGYSVYQWPDVREDERTQLWLDQLWSNRIDFISHKV